MARFVSTALVLAALGGFGMSSAARAEDWGTVKGQVKFVGNAVPVPKELNVNKDQNHCLSKGKIYSEEWVVNQKNHGVRWTFVWLTTEAGSGKLPVHPSLADFAKTNAVMDQPCCVFEPHALGVMVGQTLEVKNSAPIAHNYNYQGGLRNPGKNVSMPANSSIKIDNLKISPTSIKVSCNIHPWMSAWVRVFESPYFAVTDENGNFEIKNAPAGNYKLVSWHEAVGWGEGGKTGIPVTITAGGTTEATINLKPE